MRDKIVEGLFVIAAVAAFMAGLVFVEAIKGQVKSHNGIECYAILREEGVSPIDAGAICYGGRY